MSTSVKHIIDCDADPFVYNDEDSPEYSWKVESHKKMGQLEWDPEKIKLIDCSTNPKNGRRWRVTGHILREFLADKQVLNANVLDYLLAHEELIPEEWYEQDEVIFWGTVYDGTGPREPGDTTRCLCVRSIENDRGQWVESFCTLSEESLRDGRHHLWSPAAALL